MELGLCILLLPLSLLFASIQQVVAAPFDSIAPVLESRDSRFSNFALQNRALPTGTCNADTPCKSSHSPPFSPPMYPDVCLCFEHLLTSNLSLKA